MSFRWRLLSCLALAVLVSAAVEAATDYLELHLDVARELERAFDQVEASVEVALGVGGDRPDLAGAAYNLPPDSRVRVLRGDTVVLVLGRTRADAALLFEKRTLPDGQRLEIAVDAQRYRAPLVASMRQDLLDSGIQVALSLLIVALLARFLLRPVRRLMEAVNEVSLQRFPGTVPVPAGKDAFALLARSFNRMSANTKAAIDRERVFTRYASHELRTPLTAMKVQLEALELGASTPEEATSALRRNVNRMQRVLEALLSLARASEHDHEPVSLTLLVREAIKLLSEEGQRRVVLNGDLPPEVEMSQPYLVGQCVLNLVDNALKYTTAEVSVTLVRQGAWALIQVRDRGTGVPEAYVEKLTDTFFRLSSHVDGSGLGLAFVKHITRTLGGELSFRNVTGGFEAVLKLPVYAETSKVQWQLPQPHPLKMSKIPGERRRG